MKLHPVSEKMTVEPLSNFDAFLLRMDSPTNMAVINGLLFFEQPVDCERLRATLERRLLQYDRFRQRITQAGLLVKYPAWEYDLTFDMNAHLHRIGLPPPRDLATLKALINDLMSTPLDMSKPPWQIYLVEGYGKGSALIIRLHHSIGDGISLLQVLLALTDSEPDAPWPQGLPQHNGHRSSPLGRLLLPPLKFTTRTLQVTRRLLSESLEVVDNPQRIREKTRLAAENAAALARYLLVDDEPGTSLRGKCGVAKQAAWSEPISLEAVKAVSRALGGTVNDVMLTAITGGLRRYLEERGDEIDFPDLRAVIPVNMRSNNGTEHLGNRLGMVLLSLPVGLQEPRSRYAAVKNRMDALKVSREPGMIFGLLSSPVFSTPGAENIILDIFGAKASLLVTNVPGPQQAIYLAGRKLERMIFWVPQPAGWGLGLSIFSYNGEILLGVAGDAGLVPEPEAVAAAFVEEFKEMQAWATKPAG
jgi:WS/DGAT/MGAT family acyltransferase